MAYVGCIAGAIPIEDYRRQLIEAGFAAVRGHRHRGRPQRLRQGREPGRLLLAAVVQPARGRDGLLLAAAEPTTTCIARLLDLLRRYNVNDYAASVRVFAVKP